MKILVLNSGSSSLKFQLFDMQSMHPLAVGLIEQIGESQSHIKMEYGGAIIKKNHSVADHHTAITLMLELLKKQECLDDIHNLAGIGHRVVHGGEAFTQSALIDDEVIKIIEDLSPLAPLHNPANLIGIKITKEKAPQVPQVAVFDTAFHQTIPAEGYTYGLPYELYEQNRVRRYGFHGTSHYFVAKQAALHLGKELSATKIISLHLGNGTSATAIYHGKSMDTSMGMTPVEGLLMGTRCGDIDAGILFYLARETGRSIQELDDLANKESGLKGICGENDMRTIIEKAANGNERATLALGVFCSRIKKYIGAYLAVLNGADALVFTGGIGENASRVRELSCANMENLGLEIDLGKNKTACKDQGCHAIHTTSSQIKILVIPTNEELEIANQTLRHIPSEV